jgi:uncharacterized protein YqjF (DUF2071 family)
VSAPVFAPVIDDTSLLPSEPVPHPVMVQRWDRLAFLHWPVDPAAVAALLPDEVEVDAFDGVAWVGLIPFTLTVRRPPRLPAVPWFATTLEANVRTYVRGPDGRRGIWFFSLDASRLAAVTTARLWYRLPYTWARMRYWSNGRLVRYESRRRWPAPRGTGLRVTISVGEPIPPEDASPLERFLTWRWRLYSPGRSGPVATQVEHPPWPLHRARLLHIEEDLLAGHGLAKFSQVPLVHFSPGVVTRFSRRRVVTRPDPGFSTGLPGPSRLPARGSSPKTGRPASPGSW